MRIRPAIFLSILALAACDQNLLAPAAPQAPATPAVDATAPAPAPVRVVQPALSAGKSTGAPLARPAAARPEAYDRSTAAEKAEASAAPMAQARRLGSTVASLGNPTEQGFWIKTPLVKGAGKGRLVDPASGKSVNVDLIPLPGPESGGSQVSLAALQMLGVPLTGLPRLDVFAR